MLTKLELTGGIIAATVLALGSWQTLQATQGSVCQIEFCGTSSGQAVVESCVEVPEVMESPGDASGGGAGLPPGVCKILTTGTPCLEAEECATFFARRETPMLGGAGLLLTALGLGLGGSILRRRRSHA